MPYRTLIPSQLAKLFGVLSHPTRVRIIVELREHDLSVSDLKDKLGLSQAAVSQQLAVLRSAGLLGENRQGRIVYNHLRVPELAAWIMDGVRFISPDAQEVENMLQAIAHAQNAWHPRGGHAKRVKR